MTLSAPLAAQTAIPEPSGYVNDFATVIPDELQVQLESELRSFDEETSVEIAVVTVPSLGGDTIEGYAIRLFEEWGIGKKDVDNGVLLLLTIEERDVRIEVGYGMEPYVTDGLAGRILDGSVLPGLRAGNYGDGLAAGARALTQSIRESEYVPGDVRPRKAVEIGGSRFYTLIGLAFASLYAASYMARTREVVLGALWGAGVGGVLGWLVGGLVAVIILALATGVAGLLLDLLLSSAYKYQVKSGRDSSWASNWGGFYGAGRGGLGSGGGGGGFGGFGGGRSGGGGSSRGF